MGIFSQLKARFRRRSSRRPAMAKEERPQATGVRVDEGKRFAASETNRLNADRWFKANGRSINSILNSELRILQNRCDYEYGANPVFEGVVNSYALDAIGRDGPGLQVESDNQQFNDALEQAWAIVAAEPEPRMRQGAPEVMKTWVKQLMLAGSYLNVYSEVQRDDSPITFGWQSVHARRLLTPPEYAGEPFVGLGIRLEERTGRPTIYYVDKHRGRWIHEVQGIEFHELPARTVNHVFVSVEPEQITGYPLMTSALETSSQMRDLQLTVLEALKTQAHLTPLLQVKHPELSTGVDPLPDACIPMERGQANVAPLGYEWATFQSTQPSAQYESYYGMLAGEVGRPVHMPKMAVMLHVGDANFSSAQYEGAVYAEGIGALQSLIQRRTLEPAIQLIARELALRGMTTIPDKWTSVWTWNVPPTANFEKHVRALIELVRNGIIAPSQASAMLGYDYEKVVAARQKCEELLEAAELPGTPIDGAESEADEIEIEELENNAPNNRLANLGL